MSKTSTRLLKASLSALHYSGAARLLAPTARGHGAVLMLHHVAPDDTASGFAPNGILTITPAFLEEVIVAVRQEGFDIVSMDEANERIRGERIRGERLSGERVSGAVANPRPFVTFTFDDGYRDNRDHAYPILKRHGVPMTIYVASDFAEHKGFLWWIVLERVIARRQVLAVAINGKIETFSCVSDTAKTAAFERIYWWLRALPETQARAVVRELANESGIDIHEPCRELAMTWEEIAAFAKDPLVTIGAHAVSHMALGKLSAPEALAEMQQSIADVEHHVGAPCRHFCYPYGDAGSAGEREFEMAAQLGMETAVTTRKGNIAADHAGRMTALPRLSLNGDYQQIRYVKALLSGVPFKLLDAARRAVQRGRTQPVYSPAGVSGLCIQRTSQAAGTTHASPPTT